MNPKTPGAAFLAALTLATGNAQEAQLDNPPPNEPPAAISEEANTPYTPFKLYFDNMTGGEAISVAAVLGDIPDNPRFHTLRRMATGAEVALESILQEVDVSDDGTGTYRLTVPAVAHQALNAYASRSINKSEFNSDWLGERTLYEANQSDQFAEHHLETLTGIGATPQDAIAHMLTSAHAQVALKSRTELENTWTNTRRYDSDGNVSEDHNTTSRLEERSVAGQYGAISLPNDITVFRLVVDGIEIGYGAESNDGRYIAPTREALGGSPPNTLVVDRR